MNVNEAIHGYIVLRKPEFNSSMYDDYVRDFEGIYYGGITRYSWEEVALDYYSKKLPENLTKIYNSINDETKYSESGILSTSNFDIAVELLAYCNRYEAKSELVSFIIINSTEKSSIVPQAKIEWKGYDVLLKDEFSVLSLGAFMHPSLFIRFRNMINSYGLFKLDKIEDIEAYIKYYSFLEKEYGIESLEANPEFEIYKIGIVCV